MASREASPGKTIRKVAKVPGALPKKIQKGGAELIQKNWEVTIRVPLADTFEETYDKICGWSRRLCKPLVTFWRQADEWP